MQKARIGWAKREIVPKKELPLTGYTPLRFFDSIHDPVFTKVVAMQQEGKTYFFVVLDLVAVDHHFYQRIRQMLEEISVGLLNVTIAATHTHSAPGGTVKTDSGVLKGSENVLGYWDESYVAYCVQQTKEAALEAVRNAEYSMLKIGRSSVTEVWKNRNNEDGPFDDALLAIEIKQDSGNKMLLYHYACHPTVLNQSNTSISKDLPYGVESYLDEYDMVLFINGNCGDISTRFTRKEASISQIIEFGEKIGLQIKKALQSPVVEERLTSVLIKEKTFLLNAKKPDNVENAKRKLREAEEALRFSGSDKVKRILEAERDGARANLFLAENLIDIEVIQVYCQLISLNNIKVLTFPGEIYYELVQEFKKQYGIEIFTYANDFNFYLTSLNAYERDYYEALSSPFEKGEGERFLQKLKEYSFFEGGELP